MGGALGIPVKTICVTYLDSGVDLSYTLGR